MISVWHRVSRVLARRALQYMLGDCTGTTVKLCGEAITTLAKNWIGMSVDFKSLPQWCLPLRGPWFECSGALTEGIVLYIID